MLQLLLQLDTWLLLFGFALAFRQLRVILAAEQGRKHDLVKKLYKVNTDFQVSVLIPFLDEKKLTPLLSLLNALADQTYSARKVAIHLVATHQTAAALQPLKLQQNVKIWTYPACSAYPGQAVAWLIERCLAAGGSGLLVFLKADDMVKPDFFQNVVAKGFEYPVFQGYVAMKHWPETLLGKLVSLSSKLANRVGNAGRHHLGLGSQLLESGWVVQRELLEMIPYHRGPGHDNLEYTIRLNLENYRVAWAPNVVVYSDEPRDLAEHISQSFSEAINRLQQFFRYSSPLLVRSIVRADFSSLENVLRLVQPPAFLFGTLLVVVTYFYAVANIPTQGKALSWGLLTLSFWMIQLLSLVVARSRRVDYAAFFVGTPILYALEVALLPWVLLKGISAQWSKTQPSSRYAMMGTRLNETAPYQAPLPLEQSRIPSENDNRYEQIIQEMLTRNQTLEESAIPKPTNSTAGFDFHKTTQPSTSHEEVATIAVSNGNKEIQCELKTLTYKSSGTSGTLSRMTLQYKGAAFTTEAYKLAEQAFYELQSKLMERGLSIITCGSCGYFYNPSVPHQATEKEAASSVTKTMGVCLFGKVGKNVNMETDGVTLVTPSCPYHCSIKQREQLVRDWRNSLVVESKV